MVMKIMAGFIAVVRRMCMLTCGCGKQAGKKTHVQAAVVLTALLSLAAGDSQEAPSTRPAASIAENVIAELRAADAARAELQHAQQQWAMEEKKLDMLIDSVNRRAEQLAGEAADAERKQTELKKRVAVEQAAQQRLVKVEAMADALSERLEQSLEAMKTRSLPGLVPPDTAAGITDPARRFATDVDRLAKTEQNARTSSVELVNAELGGDTVTVKLLRAGAAGAWWMSLDGDRAGQAIMNNKKLTLEPARTEQDAQAIIKAFAVAEGQTAPHWTLLPAHHLRIQQNPEQEQ